MPTRFGVRNVGVKDGRKLRKVVGIVWLPEDADDGCYWELLSCGHEGKPVPSDGTRASQRWCQGCKYGWPPAAASPERERDA